MALRSAFKSALPLRTGRAGRTCLTAPASPCPRPRGRPTNAPTIADKPTARAINHTDRATHRYPHRCTSQHHPPEFFSVELCSTYPCRAPLHVSVSSHAPRWCRATLHVVHISVSSHAPRWCRAMLHWYVTYPCRAMLHVGVEPCSTGMSSCTYPCRAMLHVGVEPCSTVMSSFACRAMLHVGGVELCSTFNLHDNSSAHHLLQLVLAPPTSANWQVNIPMFQYRVSAHSQVQTVSSQVLSHYPCRAMLHIGVEPCSTISVSSHAPRWCRALLHVGVELCSTFKSPYRVEPCSTSLSSSAPAFCFLSVELSSRPTSVVEPCSTLYYGFVNASSTLGRDPFPIRWIRRHRLNTLIF